MLHCTKVAFLLLTQQTWVQFLAFPKMYFVVAEINQQHWSEESGQRVENVDRTHLVLASGKPVLQKFSLGKYLAKMMVVGLSELSNF